jgi:hypothetical protein
MKLMKNIKFMTKDGYCHTFVNIYKEDLAIEIILNIY